MKFADLSRHKTHLQILFILSNKVLLSTDLTQLGYKEFI